jgi:hypothetical protein
MNNPKHKTPVTAKVIRKWVLDTTKWIKRCELWFSNETSIKQIDTLTNCLQDIRLAAAGEAAIRRDLPDALQSKITTCTSYHVFLSSNSSFCS